MVDIRLMASIRLGHWQSVLDQKLKCSILLDNLYFVVAKHVCYVLYILLVCMCTCNIS